jgi:hypothetical protein
MIGVPTHVGKEIPVQMLAESPLRTGNLACRGAEASTQTVGHEGGESSTVLTVWHLVPETSLNSIGAISLMVYVAERTRPVSSPSQWG